MFKSGRSMCNGLVLMVITASVVTIPLTGCQSNSMVAVGHAAPVQNDVMAGEFRNLFLDGQVYFAGLPTETGLRLAAEHGVTTIINIISVPESTSRIPFDEKTLVEQLGMTYVFIPITPTSFSVADADRFASALEAAGGGKVLIHCASSNRVGGMWATYLARERGFETEEALARGRAAGLSRESMVKAAERVIWE